jgi:hypothetical protein
MVGSAEENRPHALVDVIEGHRTAVTENCRLDLDRQGAYGDVGCVREISLFHRFG